MCITTETADLKIGVARIQRVAESRRGLRGTLEGEHALGPRLAGELVGFPARLSRVLGQAATIRGSTEAYYQTGGVKQRISCPVDYLELLRRSAQHLMRVFAEKQRVVFN